MARLSTIAALGALLSLLGCGDVGSGAHPDGAAPPVGPVQHGPPPEGTPLLAVVPPDDELLLCAFVASCFEYPTPGAGAICARSADYDALVPLWDTYQRFLECARAGRDCDSMLRCASLGRDPADCAGGATFCDGDVKVDCSYGTGNKQHGWPVYSKDCAARGYACAANAHGFIECYGGPCMGRRCAGADQLYCDVDERERYVQTCPDWSTCTVEGGSTRCIPNAPDCETAVSCTPQEHGPPLCGDLIPYCDGDRRVFCVGGKEVSLDCAALGSACKDGRCVADCDPFTDRDRCAGDSLEVCIYGTRRAFPCAKLGLRTCAVADYQAKCVP